jgi:hypothetical protein
MCQQNDIISIFSLSHLTIKLIMDMNEKKILKTKTNLTNQNEKKKISNFKG